MRQVLEAKKISLELNRRKNIKRSNRILTSLILLFIIIFISNTYYFTNTFLIEFGFIFYVMAPILSGLYILTKSLETEDKAFLKIMESLELIEKGQTDPEVCKEAAEKLDDAVNILEGLIGLETSRVSSSWYSAINELEKDFIRKLKYRAVPALRGGIPGSLRIEYKTVALLEHIARVLIESDTKQMEIVNDILDRYEEIQPNGKDKISLIYFSRFRASKIGNMIITIITGFISISIISFTYCLFTIHNFIDLISDPKFFILGGLAVSALIATFFARAQKFTPTISELNQQSERALTEADQRNEFINSHISPYANEFSIFVQYNIITESDWTIFAIDGEEKWEEHNVEILEGGKSLRNPPEIGKRRITLSKNSNDTTFVRIRLNVKMIIPKNKLNGEIVYVIWKGDLKWTTVEIKVEDKIVDIFTNDKNITNDSKNRAEWYIPVEKHLKPPRS